jgi:hypothetical protein
LHTGFEEHMRVFVNQPRLRRNRILSQIMFFVALGVLIGSLILYWTQPIEQQLELFGVSMVLLPVGLLAAMFSVRLTNDWVRTPRPEEVLTEGLKGLGNNYTLYHYWLPARHVLVAPHGVFCLTVRFQAGHFRVKGESWRAVSGPLARFVRLLRQENIGNPSRDGRWDAERVQRWLGQVIPASGVVAEPVVVFVNSEATFEAEAPTVPVVYADSKRKPSLRKYVRQLAQDRTRPTLNKDQRRAVEEATVGEP